MPPRSSTMFLAEIGTAGAISAYFFRHITSAYSLNVSDPIKGQPVQLSDYLFVFGCGLVFWLLVMLRAKLHDSGGRQSDIRKVAKLAKLIAPITTLNLCGCLLAPFMKLPLLVRFLVLFQVSSNLALLLIWAFLSLQECMILPDTHTPQKSSPEVRDELSIPSNPIPHGRSSLPISKLRGHRNRRIFKKFFELFSNLLSSCSEGAEEGRGVTNAFGPTISGSANQVNPIQVSCASDSRFNAIQASSAYGFSRTISSGTNSKVNAICGKVDEAGGSGSGHGSGASGREENRGRYGGNDGGGGAGGGGDRGASGSGHGSGASGSGGGSEGGDRGSDGGGDRGASGSGHVSGASGSGGGSEGGDRGWDGGGADPECGGRGTSKEPAFESSDIIKMSIALTAQTTGTLMGFHVIPTPSSASKVLLVVALMDQLVAYLCGVTGILLSSNKPEDSKAVKTFAFIGFVCYTLGYILMIGMYVVMYVPWYSVLIVVLLFGVVWLILFRNGLKTRATKVWNYLKNSGNL